MKKLLIAGTVFMALILSPLSDARAAILFVGGEDSDFTKFGPYPTVSASTFGYGREALYVAAGASPASSYFLSPTLTSQSVLWIHAWFASGSSDTTDELMRVFSPDGVGRIVLKGTSTRGQYAIYTNNNSGTLTQIAAMTSACFSTAEGFDLYINYSTAGEVTLYCAGAAVADYTGNVTTNSATQLNQFYLAGAGSNGNNDVWGEVIAATSDTRNMRVVTMYPNSNGNTHNWDTAAASNVNETSINFATVDASGTSGEIDEYTTQSSPLPTTGDWSVLDVRVAGQFQVDSTGPQHVQAMVRTGGTDFSSSNLSPPQATWGYIYNDWTTNPNTGVAWTISDLNSSGFNIGFSSQN